MSFALIRILVATEPARRFFCTNGSFEDGVLSANLEISRCGLKFCNAEDHTCIVYLSDAV